MSALSVVSRGLALALLDGAWDRDSILQRGCVAFGCRPRWLPALCRRVLARCPEAPQLDELSAVLAGDPALRAAAANRRLPPIRRWALLPTRMLPVSGPLAAFGVPQIDDLAELAALFALGCAELEWFADLQRRNAVRVDRALRHYHYRWVPKRSRGHRLLETPKPRLKAIQRTIAARILNCMPPGAAAHGFVPKRSALSFVAPHVGQRVVLRVDLEDFFVSISQARVRAIFRSVGYPPPVAERLAGLCCAPTPELVIREEPRTDADAAERFVLGRRLRTAHLPQGAPTSPALSNLVAFRLDRRLAGLSRAVGASYTRYADDLAFSGDRAFERGVSTFIPRVAAIAQDEGFGVRFRKTRVMRAGTRQRLAGIVVNQRTNLARPEFDALRALLYNASRLGPAGQNRDRHPDFRAHLLGRIAWVEALNAGRGARLRRLFARIDWS